MVGQGVVSWVTKHHVFKIITGFVFKTAICSITINYSCLVNVGGEKKYISLKSRVGMPQLKMEKIKVQVSKCFS